MNRSRVQLWVPQSVPLYLIYIWSTLSKKLSVLPPTPDFGRGMWMTHLTSERKSTNRISYNTLTVLTLPFNLQWRTIRSMVPSPFWTPLKNLRLMVICLITVYRNPTHMDQYLQWHSHHHLSVMFSVIHTLTHRAQTVCSNPELLHKEKAHLRKALTQCKYPNELWTRWRKGLTSPPKRLLIRLTTRAPQVPSPLPIS